MQCPDCGALRHNGECQWIEVTCCECGDTFECGSAKFNLCPDCKTFLDERDAKATMAWFNIMEGDNERAS
jgi:hypothetical protein